MTQPQMVYIVMLRAEGCAKRALIGPVYVERAAAESAAAEFEKANSSTSAYVLERELAPAERRSAHVCRKADYCICTASDSAPDEDCPRHGHRARPRCSCGRFV